MLPLVNTRNCTATSLTYLRDVKDVHNLLYAYSPGGVFNGDSTDYLATYPGDQWVGRTRL